MDLLTRTRSWLAQQWTPAVCVLASDEADGICQAANGLSVVGLLRPFGVLAQLNGTIGVPVRTVGEAPFRLHSWRLRFFAGSTMFQPTVEAADTHLKSVLTAAAAAACDEDVPQLQSLLAQEIGGDPTPWYGVYRDEFLRMMMFGDHETMNHPVAYVLVLPSTVQGEPLAVFEELFARAGMLPPLMQQGVMEPRIPKHYVLLHDARTAPPGTLERAQHLMRQLGVSVGAQCHLLIVNSRTSEQPVGMDPRFWTTAMPGLVPEGGAGEPASYPPLPAGVASYGAALNERDVQSMAEFVRGLAVHHIIPNLEMRIRTLNHQVTSTRKGLRNQLKSLLWRKGGSGSFLSSSSTAGDSPSSTAPSTPTAAASASGPLPGSYLHSSVEGEMRALSDLALMLRDHDTAIATLRLLASDFKQDKAWKHYAAVQEALGVATVLSGGSPADAVANLKEAFYRYQQMSQYGARQRLEGTRYATRSAMMLAEYLRAIGQHSEANWIFMKAHFQEENLRAGLLLEQAAHSLLRLSPTPHVRKFAFHLVLAGLRYNLCDQKGLALRAYKQVLSVYEGKRWGLIEEHLHDVLGRQSREAGDWLGAVQHYMAMVLCPANSLSCQRAYLAQFLDVLNQAQAQLGFSPVLELPVPVVNLEVVGLQYDSQTGYGTAEARQVKGQVWRPLEAAVQPAAEGAPLTWLDGGSRASMAHKQPQHTCVVGETVVIDVEISNPLQVDLAISRLRLACSFEPAAGLGQPSSTAGPTNGAGASNKPKPLGLQIREESLTLGAGERMVVALRMVPLKAGSLSVEGVQWVLNSVAQGHQRFRIPRPKPCKLGSSKPLLDAERPPPGGIDFTVLPPMPHLEVSTPPLPAALAVGELLRLPLRLRNTGAMTMHAITCAINTPDMLLMAAEVVTTATPTSPPAAEGWDSRGSTRPTSPDASSALREQAGGAGADSSCGVGESLAPAATDGGWAHSEQGGADTAMAGPAPAAGAARAGMPPRGARRPSQSSSAVEVGLSERQGGVTVFSLGGGGSKLGVGQELHLLLWLRPCTPGDVSFNCVWYYEPVVKLDSLKFRTLRSSYAARVAPSLDCVPAALAGRSAPGTCMLQLRAVNRQGMDAFRLTQLACPDGIWQLGRLQQHGEEGKGAQQQQQQLGNGGGGSRSSVQELDVVVGPEAAAVLHYHLIPSPTPDPSTTTAPPPPPPLAGLQPPPPSSLQGEALAESVVQWFFQRAHPRRRLLPAASTASVQAAAAAGRAQQQQQQQQQQSQVEEGEEGPPGGELASPVDLVVRWEVAAGGTHRTGFHALYQHRVQEGPPIHLQLVGPGRVTHDFGTAHLCTVRMVLRVRNMLQAPATVCIEAGGRQPDGRPTQLGMPSWTPLPSRPEGGVRSSSGGWVQPIKAHVWCGRTRVTLPDVPSCETVEVPLQVAVAEPGSLTLADYTVSWSTADAPDLSGTCPGPSCIVLVEQL